MTTCGEFLVKQLEAWGVETVFGIPGVHTVELYRGLPGSRIRHVTPRHEQGAGFMADGYARVTGKPGVCFIITGPGMTNILTAMAQAAALVRGRDYVLPEDVSLVFGDVVPHRLLLSPRAEADRSFDPASELLERVPAPRIS